MTIPPSAPPVLAEEPAERAFPIQGKTTHRTIPWWLAEEAYEQYAIQFPSSARSQSLERMAQRGGFGADELDDLIPGWRDRLSYVKRLETERAALLAQARQGREDAERLRALAVGYCSTHHAPHNARHTLSEDCCGFYLSPAPQLCSCCTPPSLQRVHDRAATPSPSPEGAKC